MARLQSPVSAGQKAKEGSALNKTGDAPMATPMGTFLQGHNEANPAAVGANPKGKTLARKDNGGRPEMPGSTPLAGHTDHPVGHAAKGNSPKRGPGTKTPTDMATRRKLSTAGT